MLFSRKHEFDIYVKFILGDNVIACSSFGSNINLSLSKLQIKKLDPAAKRVSTVAGTGKAGFKDGTSLEAQVRNYVGFHLMNSFGW